MIETPQKTFESILIDKTKRKSFDIPAGNRVTVTIPFNREGVYILEINDASGVAIINTPIYVGDIYPLLPDFKDLSPKFFNRNSFGVPSILSERRFYILDFINTIRSQFGAEAVFMDNNLNTLAQDHSQNMINKNFFGHVDPSGKSPNDRAKAAGIVEGVG